jgi:hypothetical protein
MENEPVRTKTRTRVTTKEITITRKDDDESGTLRIALAVIVEGTEPILRAFVKE